MANSEHYEILIQGVEGWNEWRQKNSGIVPDLSRAELRKKILAGANLSLVNLREAFLTNSDLSGANLVGANLSGAFLQFADLRDANLGGAKLIGATLSGATLHRTRFAEANLFKANFFKADSTEAIFREVDLREGNLKEANLYAVQLHRANLSGASLFRAGLHKADFSGALLKSADLERANLENTNLCGANLMGANLQYAQMVETNLEGADLTNCLVFGISAWGLKLKGAIQTDLIITKDDQAAVHVDNLEIAQFVYLLLHNEKIRGVIDTIGQKGVLLLGRFTPERKAVLDAIRNKLRELGFVPMMFDFEKPTERDFTETILTLAGLSRFIIADITNPSSVPMELSEVIPNYMVPLVPILQEGQPAFSMFVALQKKYDWVLPVRSYKSTDQLIEKMDKAIIEPALEAANVFIKKRSEELSVLPLDGF